MSLSRAQNIFIPANINSIVIISLNTQNWIPLNNTMNTLWQIHPYLNRPHVVTWHHNDITTSNTRCIPQTMIDWFQMFVQRLKHMILIRILPAKCENKNESCIDWAEKGLCQTFGAYMSQNCWKSCSSCGKFAWKHYPLFLFLFCCVCLVFFFFLCFLFKKSIGNERERNLWLLRVAFLVQTTWHT